MLKLYIINKGTTFITNVFNPEIEDEGTAPHERGEGFENDEFAPGWEQQGRKALVAGLYDLEYLGPENLAEMVLHLTDDVLEIKPYAVKNSEGVVVANLIITSTDTGGGCWWARFFSPEDDVPLMVTATYLEAALKQPLNFSMLSELREFQKSPR